MHEGRPPPTDVHDVAAQPAAEAPAPIPDELLALMGRGVRAVRAHTHCSATNLALWPAQPVSLETLISYVRTLPSDTSLQAFTGPRRAATQLGTAAC